MSDPTYTFSSGGTLKLAIAHEWVTARAGSELCFERMAQLWPEAQLFALSASPSVHLNVGERRVRTTFLDRPARTPRGRALSLPLMEAAQSRHKHEPYDLLLTSTHAMSRAFPNPDGRPHLSYTYTPMRYAWYPHLDGRAGKWLDPARYYLRWRDAELAKKVTSFAAISSEVSERISECYERESEIIFPPCDTNFFSLPTTPSTYSEKPYVLSVGRLVEYKRHDLAIELAKRLDLPIVIAGNGPDLPRLQNLASNQHAQFITNADRHTIRHLYQNALFTAFLAYEDFGIVPVESLASGTPVLAINAGGARDTVSAEVGRLASDQSLDAVTEAARSLLHNRPIADNCSAWAQQFSYSAFDAALTKWVEENRA